MSALPFCTSIACVVTSLLRNTMRSNVAGVGPTYAGLAATTVSLVVLKLSSTYGPDPADSPLRNSSAPSSTSAPGWSVPPFSIDHVAVDDAERRRRQDAWQRRVRLLGRQHDRCRVDGLGGDALHEERSVALELADAVQREGDVGRLDGAAVGEDGVVTERERELRGVLVDLPTRRQAGHGLGHVVVLERQQACRTSPG